MGRQSPALAEGRSILRQVEGTNRPLHVGFIDDDGIEVDEGSMALIPTATYPDRKPRRFKFQGATLPDSTSRRERAKQA
jgi:hypothetical protein